MTGWRRFNGGVKDTTTVDRVSEVGPAEARLCTRPPATFTAPNFSPVRGFLRANINKCCSVRFVTCGNRASAR